MASLINNFIYNNDDENDTRAGYSMQHFMKTHSNILGGGGEVGQSVNNYDRFLNLVVPAGLVYHKSIPRTLDKNETKGDVIDDEMFDRLFHILGETKKSKSDGSRRHTKRIKIHPEIKSKTKRNTNIR